MEAILLYCLAVYWTYHVASRSDIARGARKWAHTSLHPLLVYPLSCCFCWTFWCGVLASVVVLAWFGSFQLLIAQLFVAPVVNLVLDLVVEALIRANTPPTIINTCTTTGTVGSVSYTSSIDPSNAPKNV